MNGDPIAVFSDVHGNLEALGAVLDDARKLGIVRHVCLGDVIGYGPDPGACFEIVTGLGCPVVRGNHEQALVEPGDGPAGNDYVAAGILHTRKQLDPHGIERLASWPMILAQGERVFVHGSIDAAGPWKYVTTAEDVTRQFAATPARLIFAGHTHRPAIWCLGSSGLVERVPHGHIRLDGGSRHWVNAGSVGQPRDLDRRACYVIHRPAEQEIEFRRIRYDFRTTQKKIVAVGLPRFLAQRLGLGR
jgi:predicted phosphodiesterase